eukprot:MONOS_8397.1-p1 / transcript=MONOS_8397.1 / gene=MONOS_8397 / organism=Monocercomonoides_exilis_PA203 / gene_product=unspecified product / transcript_product=unspecified product / location=Mono_scaffold00315:40121-40546(+) / protein_length=142 / sequence_SO=supercontig / SO=protein_coding / is_pseudo=false
MASKANDSIIVKNSDYLDPDKNPYKYTLNTDIAPKTQHKQASSLNIFDTSSSTSSSSSSSSSSSQAPFTPLPNPFDNLKYDTSFSSSANNNPFAGKSSFSLSSPTSQITFTAGKSQNVDMNSSIFSLSSNIPNPFDPASRK